MEIKLAKPDVTLLFENGLPEDLFKSFSEGLDVEKSQYFSTVKAAKWTSSMS